jgi:hypothetical protein
VNFIKCAKCGEEDPAFDYAHLCGPVKLKQTVMNKRIKELAHKAGLPTYNPEELEMFAELLVRECANVADRAEENGCEWIGGNILTHFGIKS